MARRSVRVDRHALERLRLEAGYVRQSDLADAAGVSASTVSRAEAGSVETMSEESARQLAAALRVELDALVLPAGILAVHDNADALAERVADKLAERLPAIVRAVLAEQAGQAGQAGQQRGRLRGRATLKPKEKDQACPALAESWLSAAIAG